MRRARSKLSNQRVARRERRVELVQVVLVSAVGENDARWSIERKRADLEVAIEAQMDGVDRDVRLVAEDVVATRTHVAALGHEVDLDLHCRDARLRRVLVALVEPLVLRALMTTLIARREAVQDVGVVEQETPKTNEGQSRRKQ